MDRPLPARQRLQPGHLLMTPGVKHLVDQCKFNPLEYLERHIRGDRGDIGAADWQTNEEALLSGDRIFSAYQIDPDLRLWIITEADRSVTTLLLPDEN